MNIIDYYSEKRRWLNRARIAFPDKDVLVEFVEQFSKINSFDPHSFSLRHTISRLFHLTPALAFRQNATQAFRDILQGLIYHNEENSLKTQLSIFVSDIDHRVMTDMCEIIIPKNKITVSPITHTILNANGELDSEFTTKYFINQALISESNIVLIPHVNWVNGAKMNVLKICNELKKANPKLITIVDGAQALANVETVIDTDGCNKDIDFYVGCGQKWITCPIPIGFARVSERFTTNNLFKDYLFTSDYFSEFAGRQDFMDKRALDTYNIHFSVLLDTVVKKFQEESGNIYSHYYIDVLENLKPIRKLLKDSGLFNILELPDDMQSGILTITGDNNLLSRFSQKLNLNKFKHTKDYHAYEKGNINFIRFSSPLDRLESADLEDFEKVIKSLL